LIYFGSWDSLKGNKLKEAYGMLLNFINGKKDFDDWENFTEEQKKLSNWVLSSWMREKAEVIMI
jgi:hypothetical protein